jgi:hypothetical protein
MHEESGDMTSVAIHPVTDPEGEVFYQAVAGERRSEGRTAGEALDALAAQLPQEEAGTVIVVLRSQPDRFFGAEQQQRLAELMARWRTARDRDEVLPMDEQAELDALIEAELRASADRSAQLADSRQG